MVIDPKRVQSLFLAAAALPTPAERAALLDRECGDEELRRRVAALLKAHDDPGSFLDKPADPGATADEPARDAVGTRIGPYKLLQKLGEGGMGSVFMAEQQEPVRRLVALKIIKPGMDSAHVLARFEAERQALALMEHPNIARVLDAGTTPDGRPFFVMELVKGVPITQFCDEHRLTPRQRLELFVPVCQAVQHAHQKGVIHRDLKPSNVLVALYDDRPVPKVIDFGIAKATGERLTERTLVTGFGSFVGTLEYMSPEQAKLNALDIDTRSDVYSLGVLLYELLTGTTPLTRQRLKEAALDELLRIIREEEPPKPSTRLSQTRGSKPVSNAAPLPPRLGELNWIVMRALEKDRSRRYETANGLARDVERYLKDEPVEACPPTLGYRLRKAFRKNRVLVTVVAAALLLLSVTTAAVSLAFLEADRQRDAADHARADEAAQRNAALHEAGEKEKARAEAVAAREDLLATLYAADMNLVQAAWDQNNVGRVLTLLDRQRPAPGQADLRGFEWHYWDRQCHDEAHKFRLPVKDHCSAALFSPDGLHIATVVNAGTNASPALKVQVWAVDGPREVHAWTFPVAVFGGGLTTLAFCGDGSRLAAVQPPSPPPVRPARPGGLHVWDLGSGKELISESLSTPFERTAALTHDGKRLVLGRTVYDLDAGTKAPLPPAVTGGPSLNAISPDGTRLMTLEGSNAPGRFQPWRLLVWDLATVMQLHAIPTTTVISGGFSADGQRLLACVAAPTVEGRTTYATTEVRVWDAATGEPRLTIPAPLSRSAQAVFSPDGQRLAGWARFGGSSVVLLWDGQKGTLLKTIKGHTNTVLDVRFSPDGARLFSIDSEANVKVWDAAQRPALPLLRPIATDFDGTRVALLGRLSGPPVVGEVGVRLVDAVGQELLRFQGHGSRVVEAAFSPDGRWVASLDVGGELIVWGSARGEVLTRTKIQGAEIADPGAGNFVRRVPLVFSRDGRRLAADVPVGTVHVWDVETGRELMTLKGQGRLLAFCPQSRYVLTRAESDGPPVVHSIEVVAWDAETGKEHFRMAKVAGSPHAIRFSEDGSRLAILTGLVTKLTDGSTYVKAQEVKVWDVAAGKELLTFSRPTDWMDAAVFSPDGRRLTTTSYQEYGENKRAEVNVWDATTGQHLRTIRESSSAIRNVAWSPDGRRLTALVPSLVSAQKVKVWDADAGHELMSLDVDDRLDRSLTNAEAHFNRDGRRLLLFGGRGGRDVERVVQVWDATPRAESPKE